VLLIGKASPALAGAHALVSATSMTRYRDMIFAHPALGESFKAGQSFTVETTNIGIGKTAGTASFFLVSTEPARLSWEMKLAAVPMSKFVSGLQHTVLGLPANSTGTAILTLPTGIQGRYRLRVEVGVRSLQRFAAPLAILSPEFTVAL
jgi:hypothetical protein